VGSDVGFRDSPAAERGSSAIENARIFLCHDVVELQWTNPHVFLLVDGKVDAADEPAVWRLETSGPANLTRQGGWSATALKPGDRVSVTINPMKEAGQHNARLNKVTVIDTGQELGATYLDLDLRRPQMMPG
jgi:Family of unknown function (DUF6152)